MTAASDGLFAFLYSSVLSPAYPASCVAAIVRNARETNAQQGFTGLLVFDGQRFCQYLEGPRHALQQLLERIQADPRHGDFTLHHQGPLAGPRAFQDWSIAYAEIEDAMPLEEIAALAGAQAQARLDALLPMLDYG
jgi:hypothetical protein